MLLAIEWGVVGIKVAQLLLSLSILVVLHEFGHYITARWFGCRVEKFYLFFDPWFSLFKKKVGETEYGVGWLPLGGYVKIAGMVDESMDKEQLKKPAQPWEFRSKPAWQRLIIMLGGIIMNVLVAFVIYAFILNHWGDKKIPAESLKYGIQVTDSSLYNIGFRNGDKILAVDGKPINDFEHALRELTVAGDKATVLRDGKEVTFSIPTDLLGKLIENKNKGRISLIEPRFPVIVQALSDDFPAAKAGLKVNDKITGIDAEPLVFFDELKNVLLTKANDSVTLHVDRAGEQLSLRSEVDSLGRLGFLPYGAGPNYRQMDSLGWVDLQVIKYPFPAAIGAGVQKTWYELTYYIDQFKKILQPSTGAYKGLGGFKTIGNAFPGVWDWESFWRMTAFLSIILAFMNLLPIPALDGGHVMFTLYEMVTGRKPSEKFLEYAIIVGMIILFALMLYANLNDWIGWGK